VSDVPDVLVSTSARQTGTYSVHPNAMIPPYYVPNEFPEVDPAMAASQVVLYFDRQEDAVQFTLAASSIIADGAPLRETALKVAKEVCKASRITTEGSVNGDAPKGKRKAQ
jgi:hypothetical protein